MPAISKCKLKKIIKELKEEIALLKEENYTLTMKLQEVNNNANKG